MEICCKNVNVVFVQHLLTLSGQGRIIDFVELMNKEKKDVVVFTQHLLTLSR